MQFTINMLIIHYVNIQLYLIGIMGGCLNNQKSNSYLMASLNFSGICLSPFEYHDSTIQKEQLSKIFGVILKMFRSDPKFSWEVGKIDLKLQRQRYTPIYRKDVCVVDGRFMQLPQFQKEWDREFQSSVTLLKDKPPTSDQINQAKQFDWISYVTIFNYLYNRNGPYLKDIDTTKDPTTYVEFLKKMHSKAYLNNLKKMQKIATYITQNSIDILFLQEAQTRQAKSWRDVISAQYQIVQKPKCESLIIYKKSKFPKDEQLCKDFEQKYGQILFFNKDSVFVLTANKQLLISVHLSSKEAINPIQAKQMNDAFVKIIKQNPQIQIYCGADSNHYIDVSTTFNQRHDDNQQLMFYVYPTEKSQFTTIKKRTQMQLQTRKADQIVREIKDQIITTRLIDYLAIDNLFIGTLDKTQANDDLFLPNEEHPFDHFLVFVKIKNN